MAEATVGKPIGAAFFGAARADLGYVILTSSWMWSLGRPAAPAPAPAGVRRSNGPWKRPLAIHGLRSATASAISTLSLSAPPADASAVSHLSKTWIRTVLHSVRSNRKAWLSNGFSGLYTTVGETKIVEP